MQTQPTLTGYRPDPPEVVARRAKFHLLMAKKGLSTATLPLKTNNRAFLPKARGGPGILNQWDTGSCTGHSAAGSTCTRFAILQQPIPLPSPIGWYTVGRLYARNLVNGTLPSLQDEGAEPSQVIRGGQEWGVASAATWGNYPANSQTINEEPTLSQLDAAGDFKLKGAYFLSSTGTQRYTGIMMALTHGYPMPIAIPASGPLFQGYTGGILGKLSGANDHYVYLIDYEWDGNDVRSLIVHGVNSWGDGSESQAWGESDVAGINAGLFRGNHSFIDQVQDACVMDVSPIVQGAVER